MRGIITLSFDDGYEAVYEHVVPFLRKYAIPAVFALPLETEAVQHSTQQPMKPWVEWLSLREQGHEIAAHGISHQSLVQLAPEMLRQELTQPAEKLSATTLVYPGGAYNDAVINEAKKLYTAARTTQYGWQTYPPADPWGLKTVDYTKDNWSLIKANLRAVWAALTDSWLIETYHLVYPTLDGVDSPKSLLHHSVPFEEFSRHIEFIRQLPVTIQTINETIRHRHN
jgi:peptidoglycan/xylan/chitin deacetylase (PgdA/CDA1 family)